MKVLTILRANGTTSRIQVEVPGAKSKKQPVVVPGSVVSAKKLENGIGWIRITMFPGMVGVEVARDISAAVRDLGCSRLIFDLRGEYRRWRRVHSPNEPTLRGKAGGRI